MTSSFSLLASAVREDPISSWGDFSADFPFADWALWRTDSTDVAITGLNKYYQPLKETSVITKSMMQLSYPCA